MIYTQSIPCPTYYAPEYQSLEERTREKIKENSLLPKPTWFDHNDLAPPEIHRYLHYYDNARHCYCGLREGLRVPYSYRLFDKGFQQ